MLYGACLFTAFHKGSIFARFFILPLWLLYDPCACSLGRPEEGSQRAAGIYRSNWGSEHTREPSSGFLEKRFRKGQAKSIMLTGSKWGMSSMKT